MGLSSPIAPQSRPNLGSWPILPQARSNLELKLHLSPQSLQCHPSIVVGPNPLNVGQTLRDTTAQEKKQALARSLPSLGKSNVPLSGKGWEYLLLTSGITWRLWQQVWGHSWSQMVLWMRRSGLHLTASRLMHHTYEVMEARGWIQRDFSPEYKVLADIQHCVAFTAALHSNNKHIHV